MYVNHDAKIIYLAHPRTASVATGKSLLNIGFNWVGPHLHARHHARIFHKDSPVIPETRDQWTTITTVRNHWDACASWMFSQLRHTQEPRWGVEDFKKWLDHSMYIKPDRLWWLHSDDADIIWRFETLQSDFDKTLAALNLPPTELLLDNVTPSRKGRPYQEVYSQTTRDYIGDRFKEEIERFGYTF